MSATVVIYRKGNNVPKVNADVIANMKDEIKGRCRVQRPGIVEFFTPPRGNVRSEFYKLAELSPNIIDNPYRRVKEHGTDGYVVDADDLGRKVAKGYDPDQSTVQSVLLWIKQNLSDVVSPTDVSVVLEDR